MKNRIYQNSHVCRVHTYNSILQTVKKKKKNFVKLHILCIPVINNKNNF